MNFGANNEYMKLDGHFGSNYGDLNVLMIWPRSSVFMITHKLSGFRNKICSFQLN